jgi:hypothetical protein
MMDEPAVKTQMAGKGAVFEGLDRAGFEHSERSSLQARLSVTGPLLLSVHVSAEASRLGDFDLASSSTDWFLCKVDPNNLRSCQWRIGLAACSATRSSSGVRTVTLNGQGAVSFEVSRLYKPLTDLSRTVRAYGSVSGHAFDETNYFRLLKDSYDTNYAHERLAVLFPSTSGVGCGFALEESADEQPAKAYLFDCDFVQVGVLDIKSIVDDARSP